MTEEVINRTLLLVTAIQICLTRPPADQTTDCPTLGQARRSNFSVSEIA